MAVEIFSAKSYRSQMPVEKMCRFSNHPALQSKKNCRLEKAQGCIIKKPSGEDDSAGGIDDSSDDSSDEQRVDFITVSRYNYKKKIV